MFNNAMTERINNKVNISDINQDVFEEMLAYIYTGEVNNLYVLSAKLTVAADKYQISNRTSKIDLSTEGSLSFLLKIAYIY